MSRHTLHYFDLNPENQEPPTWALILGAAVTLVALWVVLCVAFTL